MTTTNTQATSERPESSAPEASDAVTCVNANSPAVRLFHRSLKRDHGEFASCCPFCAAGILLMQRDRRTFVLLAEDVCSICAQCVVYADIESGHMNLVYNTVQF